MKAEYGYCLVCEKRIVSDCSHCAKKAPNEFYTEVEVAWSNGSRMRIAVCTDCAKGPVWSADKQAMTQAHFDAWDKEGGKYDKEVVIV